jgi:hypothetical protein
MRVHKEFGKRAVVLLSSEVRKKYFLIFEGEKTEILYFKGINDHRIQLKINPLIEIKPIMRSFDEKGWSNPKKLLDRLIEYIEESHMEKFTLNSIIIKVIDFLIIDDVIGSESIYNPDDIKKKILNYFTNDKKIKDFNEVRDLEESTSDIIKCLNDTIDISSIIPDLVVYIQSQKIVFDKEIDKICLIVDRDKESFVNNPTNDQYTYVVEKCRENEIDFYLTNPCFEFWLLLHFDEVHHLDKNSLLDNPKITAKKRYAEVELCKLVSGYKKNQIKFEKFITNIDKAIINEKNFCEDINELQCKVGSNIGNLISEMKE